MDAYCLPQHVWSKCTMPRWLEREIVTNSHMSKAIQYRKYQHQLRQLHLLWNFLFQGVWKSHCISIRNSRRISGLQPSKLANTRWCICWWNFDYIWPPKKSHLAIFCNKSRMAQSLSLHYGQKCCIKVKFLYLSRIWKANFDHQWHMYNYSSHYSDSCYQWKIIIETNS